MDSAVRGRALNSMFLTSSFQLESFHDFINICDCHQQDADVDRGKEKGKSPRPCTDLATLHLLYQKLYVHLYKKSLKYRKILIISQGKAAFLLIPDGVTMSFQRHETSSSGRIIPALLCSLCFLITQSMDTFPNVRTSS